MVGGQPRAGLPVTGARGTRRSVNLTVQNSVILPDSYSSVPPATLCAARRLWEPGRL